MANTTITPSAGALTVAGAAGLMGYLMAPAAGSLAFAGVAPKAVPGTLIIPPGAGLSLVGQAGFAQPNLVGPINGVSPGLPGGVSARYNITAACVIKAAPGIIFQISCITTGVITLNDCIATGGAIAANEIGAFSLTGGGAPFLLEWPCSKGIVVSAVSAGQFAISFT